MKMPCPLINSTILCHQHNVQSPFGLEEVGIIANIIIAGLALLVAYYVFIHQRQRDNQSALDTTKYHKKSIKIQWFKEIVVDPHIDEVFAYFEDMKGIADRMETDELTIEFKYELLDFIKEQSSELRKSFLNRLQFITKNLFEDLTLVLDQLTDNLTILIAEEEIELFDYEDFNAEINEIVDLTYDQFMGLIFNYDGD